MTLAPPLLEARGIGCSIATKALFTSVDLVIRAEDLVCIVGENGAGKTLLLQVLAQERAADSGSVVSHGKALLLSAHRQSLNSHVDVTKAVGDLTSAPRQHIERLLADYAIDTSQPYVDLSTGERQRVMLAAASVATDAQVVLFDGPAAGLDSDGFDLLEDVVADLTARQRAVVIATTSPEVVMRLSTSRLYSLSGGSLALVRPVAETCHLKVVD